VPPRPFRARLFSILLGFALIPTVLLTAGLVGSTGAILPLVGASAAWDSVASTGDRALDALRAAPLTDEQRATLAAHEQELSASVTQARRVRFVSQRASAVVAVAGLLLFAVLAYVASRVAGHLSRQLSRPLDELSDWTERVARGEALPATATARGAPEFEVLRSGMRAMASELEVSRARALDAERLRAMRESARQVAHELKNPLTPIRLALLRVAKAAPPEVRDAVEVLETETRRIDTLARNFAQFGRLPEGAMAPVDMSELVRYTARATVPDEVRTELDVADALPAVVGQYEALSRALSNVLLNAVDAVRHAAAPHILVRAERLDDRIRVAVTDNGAGIPPDALPRIWEPYVTTKPAGTGLGLAIVRQTVEAHHGTVFAESAPGAGTTIGFVLPGVATPQPVHP
jgi:signal transduction histidine kinase